MKALRISIMVEVGEMTREQEFIRTRNDALHTQNEIPLIELKVHPGSLAARIYDIATALEPLLKQENII